MSKLNLTTAWRLPLFLARAILGVPVVVFWWLVCLTLPIGKALVVYPLGLATAGAYIVTAYFAITGDWPDATRGAVLGVVATAVFGLYVAAAERADPSFGRREPLPPWWWTL